MSDNKPKPIPRKTPGGSSSGGKKMTMREQIAARKKAESAGQASVPAAKTAPKQASKPAAKVAAKPAARKATPAKRAAAAPAKAAASSEKAAGKAGASSRPARSGARSGAGSKRGGAAKGRRGAAADEEKGDDNGGTTRGRRGRPEPKKKSPVPMIATAVVVLGGAGAYFGGVFDSSPAEAADNTTETADATGTDVDTASIGGAAGADAPTESDATDAGAAADAPEAPAAAADAPEEEPEAAASKEEAKAAAKAKAEAERAERLDLSGLVPFGKPPEATDEEWATLQEKAAEYFDPFSGAAGGRAEKKLIAAGKNAWPAILNELIKINPEDPEENRMGFRATLAMSKARGSETPNGFDWRSAQNSATGEIKSVDLYYNQRLIKVLYEGWAAVLEDPAHWAKYDKTEVAAEAAAKAKAKAEAAAKESGEFDDLDIPEID